MKSHIQGLFILLGVGIALMVLANIAAPVVGNAFGEDGAIVAESAAEDVVDLAAAEQEIVVPLTGEEVADLIVFLAGDKAAFITGTEIVIDGGRLAAIYPESLRRTLF